MTQDPNLTPNTPTDPGAESDMAAAAAVPPAIPPAQGGYEGYAAYQPAPVPAKQEKIPLLAGFLSILPGLGNIYNGLYTRAVGFFFLYVTLFSVLTGHDHSHVEASFLVPTLIFVWLFNIFDAYRQAVLINNGWTQGQDSPPANAGAQGGLAIGAALILIGVLVLLDRWFNIDLSIIFEQWPVAVIGFGIWMVVQAIRARRQEAIAELDEL
ncbi:MAG: DUF5668 domain-containing protein [Acidobacteriota bacterium]